MYVIIILLLSLAFKKSC